MKNANVIEVTIHKMDNGYVFFNNNKALIVKDYKDLETLFMGDLLPRVKRAYKTSKSNSRLNKMWNEAEDLQLIDLMKKFKPKRVAKEMNRSVNAVRIRYSVLNRTTKEA
jgi:hypothetical protein